MQVLRVFGELARPSIRENKKERYAQKTAGEDDHFAFEKRSSDPLVLRGAVPPAPKDPRERLVHADGPDPLQRFAQGWLVVEASRNVLSRDPANPHEEQ